MPLNIQTVASVNRYLKGLIEGDFLLSDLNVRGEVSGVKYHPSGHLYFTLKDAEGQLAAVMFAGSRRGLTFRMENGDHVVCGGRIGLYEKSGSYQLYVRSIRKEGIGDLYRQYEELKARLLEMGMFDAIYKKPIPAYARRVGIVTASSGAALRDIVQIASRRNPYVQLILSPALVQGEGAPASLVRAIERMDALHPDVMIVGRGGGSWEDLSAFNTEEVARAVFDCDTPVISAVGHETDTSIIDYVADLRAPTPSAAAELAVFDYQAFLERIARGRQALAAAVRETLDARHLKLSRLKLRLAQMNPGRRIESRRMRLAELADKLWRIPREKLRDARTALDLMRVRLAAQNPAAKLSEGYAMVSDRSGKLIRRVSDLADGQELVLQMADGRAEVRVLRIEKENDHDCTE